MINAYLKDSVTLRSVSYDSYNKATYADTTMKCYLEFGRKIVTTTAGPQTVAETKLITPTSTMKPGDRVTIDGVDWLITAVGRIRYFNKKYYQAFLEQAR